MSKCKLWAAAMAFVCVFQGFKAGAQEVLLADKVVAVIGSSSILYSDVVNMKNELVDVYRAQGFTSDKDPMCEALEKLMIMKVLYNQARVDSLEIATGEIAVSVQKVIDQEVMLAGSITALEKKYHKPVHVIRTDLQKRYEELYYANTMEQEVKRDVKITPGEVEKYFRVLPKDSLPIIPEQYVFSQITKMPPSKTEADIRTRERLLELRARIVNGDSFATLARMYSDDPASRMRGGEMDPQPRDALTRPFGDALVRLKAGQISDIVETEYGFHIIQLIRKQGAFYRFRHILLRPQFTDQEVAVVFQSLDSIRKEIISGNIRFDEAAQKYSDDKYSKNNGGRATNLDKMAFEGDTDAKMATTHFFREQLNPEDDEVLRNMKPGDISNAYNSLDLRGNISGKIIRLDYILPAHQADFKEDYDVIAEKALIDKQKKVFDKWLEEKASGMYIRIDDKFRGYDFENKFLLQ